VDSPIRTSKPLLIAGQFNHRVIEITPAGDVVRSFGPGADGLFARSVIGVSAVQRIGTLTPMAGTGTRGGEWSPGVPDGAVDSGVTVR